MRRPLMAAGTVLAALAVVPSASAAVRIGSAACNRFALGSGQAGRAWVPVLGGGVFPGEPLRLTWSDGTSFGSTTSDATGAFGLRGLMPSAFIRARGPHVSSYRLTAFDATNGARLGSGQVRFVRIDNGFAARRRPHQVTSWGLWGAPAGRDVWIHFYFGGKQRRVVYMGRANRPCGVLHKRMQVLPARTRYGTWRVYFTNSRRALSGRAIRERRYIAYRLSFTVYRIYVPR